MPTSHLPVGSAGSRYIYRSSESRAQQFSSRPSVERALTNQASKKKTYMAAGKSKILVIGGTGYLGRHVVAASARLGHPTFALVRDPAPPDPTKA
jgi:hypothetical protein